MMEWWGTYYQYQIDQRGPSYISAQEDTAISTVNKRLRNEEYLKYCEERRAETERKNEMSAGERMGAVLDRVMSSLERQIELAGGSDEKVLALIPKVVELGRLVPPTKSKRGPLDVFEVGATDEDFPVVDVEDAREEVASAPVGVEFEDSDGKFANSGEEVEWDPDDTFEELE